MNITINAHSSIKVSDRLNIYFDPFEIKEENHDADLIFISHSHYDHYNPESINMIVKEDTVFVAPETIEIDYPNTVYVKPDQSLEILGYQIETVRAYNPNKQFHPKENNWVGYVVTVDGKRIYVAGDTDINEDILKVKCDIALVPVGGKYTMDYREASEFVNAIKPELAIPTHYGNVAGGTDEGLKFKEMVDKDIEVRVII